MRFLWVLVIFLSLSLPAFAGFEEGKKAYEEENWMRVIAELRPLAERGHAESLVLLGNMYNDGKGVIKEPKIALEHYKQATRQGSIEAMISLAGMHAGGVGTEKDLSKALILYERAAEKGNVLGQFFAGNLYYMGDTKGKSFEQDKGKAYKYLSALSVSETAPKDLKKKAEEVSKRIFNELKEEKE